MPNAFGLAVLELEDDELALLFKPVQLRVLEKLSRNDELDSNEERYLRGRLGRKIRLVDRLMHHGRRPKDALDTILAQLGEYYITGYEALKHNGFGWYFVPKWIDVVNTRLEGRLNVGGKPVIFHRLKSIGRDWWNADRETGRRYATNQRILADARRLGKKSLVSTWLSMLERYGKAFVPDPGKYDGLFPAATNLGRPQDYGV